MQSFGPIFVATRYPVEVSASIAEVGEFGPIHVCVETKFGGLTFHGLPTLRSDAEEHVQLLSKPVRLALMLSGSESGPEAIILAIDERKSTPRALAGIVLGGYELVGAKVENATDLFQLAPIALRRLIEDPFCEVTIENEIDLAA